MKVYSVWKGEYSDRAMIGVFSTYEKAEAYRQAMALVCKSIDDEPDEHEVDDVLKTCFIDIRLTESGELHRCQYGYTRETETEIYLNEGVYSIPVLFQFDKDRMIKAARDKLAQFKALKAGL